MENLNHRILGIISIFKYPGSISPADKFTIYLAFNNLIRVLPGFFRALEVGQPSDVIISELTQSGKPKYSQRYLLVIKRISDIIGTQLYCKKILDKDDSKPIEQIYIIGQEAEIILVNCIANWLHIMFEGIIRTSRFATRGILTGKAHRKKYELEIFIEVYNKLEKALPYRNSMTPKDGLELRNKKVFDYIRKFVKLEYNKKNVPNNPNIENARSLPGQFKHHKLL